MNLYPCAYSMTFNVTGKKPQRDTQPALAGHAYCNSWNVCQYATLVHMIAQVSGLEPGEFVHVIADAHIYDKHVPIVEELIKREHLRRAEIRPRQVDNGFLQVHARQRAF